MGNEEWGIEGNEKGARIAAIMQAVAKHPDPTRLATAAISGGWGKGISTVMDVMGYNYITGKSTDNQHAQFPNQPGVGTEATTPREPVLFPKPTVCLQSPGVQFPGFHQSRQENTNGHRTISSGDV